MIAMILPVLILGAAGSLYYQGVIKERVWEDNLNNAKTLANQITSDLDSRATYLKNTADSRYFIHSMRDRNLTNLSLSLQYIYANNDGFYYLYITDASGQVLSSYPYDHIVGANLLQKPYIRQPLDTGGVYVGDPDMGVTSAEPAINIGVPIISPDGDKLGVIVGTLKPEYLSQSVFGPGTDSPCSKYLVNHSGYVIVHNCVSHDLQQCDHSKTPAVANVIRGREGILEQYDEAENENGLASYAPVGKYGWGIVVSMPAEDAYRPVEEANRALTVAIGFIVLIAAILSVITGDYFVGPIVELSKAASEIPDGDYRRHLPLKRRDEIGSLAKSFDQLAGTILTDRKKVMDEKKNAEEARDRAELYMDIMGHDINNLNQVASTSLEIVATGNNLSDVQQELIEKAMASIRRSSDIIYNVHTIQLISKDQLKIEVVDIGALLSRSISETPTPQNKNVIISCDQKRGLYTRGTPLLKEVFANIINNLIKYSGDEVEITINVENAVIDNMNFYRISFSDNGFGIPDDVKPKLFKRLQRGNTKTDGKGLGLYIIKMLVESFDGTVRIEDRIPGDYTKGARIIIMLPAVENGLNN